MANQPAYAATPKLGQGQVATANTARDGTGTVVTLLTAGAQGSKIEQIEYINVGTVAANIIRIFTTPSGGTARLVREYLTTANTPSGTVRAIPYAEVFDNFVIPALCVVTASVHTTGELYNISVFYGDF